MSISSVSSSDSFDIYDTEIFQTIKDFTWKAFPVYPVVEAFSAITRNLYPSLFLDDIDDLDGEDFLVNSTQATRDKISDIYIERRVQITGEIPEDKKRELLASFKTTFSQILLDRYNKINELAHKMGIEKVLFNISIPTELAADQQIAPYAAIGVYIHY